MANPGLLPSSLARRFAVVAAGLAAGAVLLSVLASWWLINQQQEQAVRQLAAREREFHATTVASDLHALASRMSEVADSTILATGLVDSAGRETYLQPFLAGIRQINGVPVQVLFTDFEGKEIAHNSGARFTAAELDWLRGVIQKGIATAAIFEEKGETALVAVEPLTYTRTKSPEGAVLYKILLNDLHIGASMRLLWGNPPGSPAVSETTVPAPEVFKELRFRVTGPDALAPAELSLGPQYATMLAIALILFAGVVVAGVRLAQVLTRDLQQLEAFSKRMIRSGLGTERAPTGGSAEVSSLAVSMNQMLDRLHEQQTVLLREREKLAGLADALQAADRTKDEFLAVLAHELRNPLAPIKNSVTLLKAKHLDDPQLAWARDVIDRQIDQMARLLDDLLDVSRITRNKLELRRETVELRLVLDAALETSRPLIEAAAHTLIVDLPPQPIYVDADPLRLAQVFANLLNNAAKYTPRGGEIRITAELLDGDVAVRVGDTGIGIAREALSQIFEMFIQTGTSSQGPSGGLGIGLSLVRGLVEMHGGTVMAKSEGPGKGSEFIVRLPLAAAVTEAAPAAEPSKLSSVRGERIVLADDNRDAAESLAMMLRISGHDVRIAHDGVEAVKLAGDFRPRVVLLDIGMPLMNGYEAARQLRSAAWGKEMVIVALTGWGQEEDKRRAAEAGFDHHLVKPVDPAAVEEVIAGR